MTAIPEGAPAAPAARLRQAAGVLTAVDRFQRGELTQMPEFVTEAQWDAACEIPSNIRTALAAVLERAAHAHEATLIAAGQTWASVMDPRAVAFVEHMTNTEALALADAILAAVTRRARGAG